MVKTKPLTYCLHSACRFLGMEDRLASQMEVVGEKHSSFFIRVLARFLAVKNQ